MLQQYCPIGIPAPPGDVVQVEENAGEAGPSPCTRAQLGAIALLHVSGAPTPRASATSRLATAAGISNRDMGTRCDLMM